MPAYFQTRAVYRGLKTAAGLATMRDVWSFARWMGEQLGQNVVVDGVEYVKAGFLKTEVPLAATARTSAGHKPEVPVLRFTRSRGLALAADLQQLAAWLQPQLEHRLRNNDARLSLRRKAARLPVPKKGLLRRSELLEFIQVAAASLGFEARADDLTGIRDTGHGIHVSRRSRTASIIVELQERSGHSKPCFAFLPEDMDTGYITVRVITYTHAGGSYTETFTASGAIQSGGPDVDFADCADVVFDSTFDPETDYGALEDVSVSDTLVPWDDARSAAIAEIADAGEPYVRWNGSWPEQEWRAASGPRSEFAGNSSSRVGYIQGEGVLAGWNHLVPKIRLKNTGQTRLEVEITFTRQSDDETETLAPVVVEAGQESDWISLRVPDPGELWIATITRLSIGGF